MALGPGKATGSQGYGIGSWQGYWVTGFNWFWAPEVDRHRPTQPKQAAMVPSAGDAMVLQSAIAAEQMLLLSKGRIPFIL